MTADPDELESTVRRGRAHPSEAMSACLAEIGYQADLAGGGRVLVKADEIPPSVALRAWQIAHNDHTMTLAEYVASLKANYPKLAAGYDRWMKQHGVTLDEVDA